MMARVRDVIVRSICDTSMFHVAASESTTTGVAPARTMAAAQEMMVNAGRITSSPLPIPRATTASSSATVPFATATPYARPHRAAMPRSNLSTNGPSDEIQPLSMHWARYVFSFPFSSGSLTGMNDRVNPPAP
jgi:hypothetical protein